MREFLEDDVVEETAVRPGLLILAGNDLGNIDDLPMRSVRSVQSADLHVFESDEIARRVLKAAGIHTKWCLLNKIHTKETLERVRQALIESKTVIFMSDAGMCGVCDPGSALVQCAHEVKARVDVIPGPSSFTAILAASPVPVHRYYFAGFPPRDHERVQALRAWAQFPDPVIWADTPYRKQAFLEDLKAAYGPDRRVLLAVDISGAHSRFQYVDLKDLRALPEKAPFVVMVYPWSGAGHHTDVASSVPTIVRGKGGRVVSKERRRGAAGQCQWQKF